MIRRAVALSLVAVVAVVLAACGIPRSSRVTRVAPDPKFHLDLTTSTSTTTTTTLAATTTIVVDTSTPPVTEATTTIPTESYSLYFVAGTRLQPVVVTLAKDAGLELLAATLFLGVPDSQASTGLRTLLPAATDPAATVTIEGGVLAVDLAQPVVDHLAALDPTEQSLAWGQLVVTLLQGRYGEILFRSAGTPIAVVDGAGSTVEAGAHVSVETYADLLGT